MLIQLLKENAMSLTQVVDRVKIARGLITYAIHDEDSI